MSKVLLVEDDNSLIEVLKYNLTNESYSVITTKEGLQAIEIARFEKPDLIMLDIMLPGLDGFEICRILRKEMTTPIIILTARTDIVDRITGLEVGADDYITKPFGMRELMARVRALLRRSSLVINQSSTKHAAEGKFGALITGKRLDIDVTRHKAYREGIELKLTPKEFDLLIFLIRNRGIVCSREKLIERLWGPDYQGTTRTVDVHICALRQKIEDNPDNPRHLIAIHGYGYKFED